MRIRVRWAEIRFFRISAIGSEPGDLYATRSIDNAEIEKREVSPVSMMPPGFINTMNQEEILDLMMYIVSGGKVGHNALQK